MRRFVDFFFLLNKGIHSNGAIRRQFFVLHNNQYKGGDTMWDIGTIVRMNEKAGQSTIRELLDKARIAFEKNDKQEFNRILEAIKAKL